MGGTEVAVALGIASAAASAKAANDQNKAISKSARSAERGNQAQNEQIQKSTELERKKLQSRRAVVEGLIRVSGAGRGVGVAGSVESQLRQSDLDAQLNLDTINLNEASANEAAQSRLEAIGIDLRSRELNPILAGFTGGIQGVSTGLSIVDTAQQIQLANKAKS